MSVLSIVCIVLLGATLTGCGGPEDRIAGHIESLTDILDDNLDDPADGVQEVEAYLIENISDITSAASELVVEIYEIDNEEQAKDRVKEVRETLEEAMNEFMKTAEKFQRKARDDKDALEEMKRIQEKLARLGRLAALVD